MWRKIFSVATAAVLSLGMLSLAQAQTLDEIKQRGVLNVGVMVDFPPYGLMNAQNQPDGYDIEVAKSLADYLGVSVELVPMASTNRIPFLKAKQIDALVASLAVTAERAKEIAFSKPYGALDVVVYGRADIKMETFADLAGVRIGVSRGSATDRAVTENAPQGTQIMRFEDSSSSVHALLSEQIDALALSDRVIQEIDAAAPAGKFNIKFLVSRAYLAAGLRLGEEDLLGAVNAFIDAKIADGSLNELHQKWISSPLPSFPE